MLKKVFIGFVFFLATTQLFAQKIDSIYVHLYTDSLKVGTYNYINIDGKLSSGGYLPLDTSHLVLTASDGKWEGNSLWIEPDFKKKKISFKAVLKTNPAIFKTFDIYIKQLPDPELPTEKELLQKMEMERKTKKS